MGGRGASSATGKYKLNNNGEILDVAYGDEYRTIASFKTSHGEVKVLESKLKANNSLPIGTKAKNRIYALANEDGKLKTIGFYDDSGKRTESWDIAVGYNSHRHKRGSKRKRGSANHKHIGIKHTDSNTAVLNKQEKKFLRELKSKWARKRRRIENRSLIQQQLPTGVKLA